MTHNIKKKNSKDNYLIDSIDQMSDREFRELLFHLFKHQGYNVSSIKLTDKADRYLLLRKGVDETIVNATISHSKLVGTRSIDKIVNTVHNYKGCHQWIITNGYFTKQSVTKANKNEVMLFNRDDLINMLDQYNLPPSSNTYNEGKKRKGK
ncbi:restriction endonuclease [Aquibacillus kalidii]|uniref:restriction endonuclease n=1 Tax=Aquibacillus kalidii TaxID=2762597 RepID=UPI001646AD0F|nr:restriction endonuclease [Aquibacillus kalidii]